MMLTSIFPRASRAHIPLSLFVLFICAGVACSSDNAQPAGGVEVFSGYTPSCITDQDKDGYGVGCPAGYDCDDQNPAVTNGCFGCTIPQTGCPCTTEGRTTDCGIISSQVGNVTTCMSGERTCSGGSWGECKFGDFSSTTSLAPRALGANIVCDDLLCDPHCQHFPDEPEDGIDGLGIGVYADSNGVQLIPKAANAGTTTCVDETNTPEPLGLDVYMVVDNSGSMNGVAWNNTKSAITDFVNSPQSVGIGLGIKNFAGTECDPLVYATPNVDIGVLQGAGSPQANAIITEINSWSMGGGTPTAAAIQGAVDRALQQKLSFPDHEVVVVLATDGEPTECPDVDALLATITTIETGYLQGIPTYVIGVGDGAGEANLHAMGRAGQGLTDPLAEPAFIVDSGSSQALLDAMNSIRIEALPCEYKVPRPSNGVLDPTQTSLEYTPGVGPMVLWPRLNDVTECLPGVDGWYFDDPVEPETLTICPESCDKIKADLNAQLNLTYSCVPACLDITEGAMFDELNVYVSFDASERMNDEIPLTGGQTRWDRMAAGFKAFTTEPRSEDMKMGLQYFGRYTEGNECTDVGLLCNSSDYQAPDVPFDTLISPAAGAIATSLDATVACHKAPVAPALEGAITEARTWAGATSEKTLVVLATSSVGDACDANLGCVDADVTSCLSRTAPWLCDCCPLGQTSCSGGCVDTNTDETNCGGCGIPCGVGESCIAGSCELCDAGMTSCPGPVCVDLESDEANCGGCGIPCGGGETCVNGTCELLPDCATSADCAGLTCCDGMCVDTTSDSNHCGGCFAACNRGGICCTSVCANSPSTDTSNCGGCGITCGAGETCETGTCAAPCDRAIVCASPEDTSCFQDCQADKASATSTLTTEAIAQAGVSGTPSIRTYVVGMGVAAPIQSLLDNVAAQGGTTASILADDGSADGFLDAMRIIRTAELPCEVQLPTMPWGDLDKTTIRLQYTEGAGGQELWTDVTATGCAASGLDTQAWVWDDPVAQTKINLCPAACDRYKADGAATLDAIYRCEAIYAAGIFEREYDMTDQCGVGEAPVWGMWSWTAQTPGDSHIDFEVRAMMPDDTWSAYVPLQFVEPGLPLPLWWLGGMDGAQAIAQATPDTQIAYTFVDTTLVNQVLPKQASKIEIRATLYPTSDLLASPILQAWDLEVSCQPFE